MSTSVADLPTDFVIDLREPVRLREVHVDAAAAPPAPAVPSPTYVRWVKPVFDRLVAAVLIVITVPLLIAVALSIRLVMGRGVIYRQQRIGEGGRPFGVYKFRTMLPDRRRTDVEWDGCERRSSHKRIDDPRHTPLGRFLRRWSLDELPQLFNVLRGEMSLVGPRPELVHVVRQYEPWEHARHVVRPGLTGLWQTTARAQGPTHLFTKLDLEYIRSISFVTDLRILLATIPAALGAQKGH